MAGLPSGADPWSSLAGGIFGTATAIATQPAGPAISGAGSFDLRSFMDGSGWTVSTGSSKATGGARTQSGDPFGSPFVGTPVQAGGGLSQPWLLAGLALVGLVILKKHR